MADYAIVDPDDADDAYAGSDVPGAFRSLTDKLGGDQLAVTLIRIPHSDFEQGTGIDGTWYRRYQVPVLPPRHELGRSRKETGIWHTLR